jgi:hypothetical protein
MINGTFITIKSDIWINWFSVINIPFFEQNGGFSENKMQKLSLQKSILSKTLKLRHG